MYRFLDHPVGVEVANAVDVGGAPVLGGDVGVAPVNRGGRGQAGGRQRGESHIPSPMKLDFFPTYVRERREKNYQGYNSLSFVVDK